MAFTTPAHSPTWLDMIFNAFGAVRRVVAATLIVNTSAEARFQQVQSLQAKSDADLAKLGIRREKIVQHVFRDIYMI